MAGTDHRQGAGSPGMAVPRPAAMLRLLAGSALVAFCLWQVMGHLRAVDLSLLLATLSAIAPWQWLGAAVAVCTAFLAVAGQERAIRCHLGLDPPRSQAATAAAMASAAVSQTLGFGPLIGALLRQRLLPDLSFRQSATISLGITIGFFAGLALLWAGMTTTLRFGAPGLLVVPALLGLALPLLRHLTRRHGLRLPGWLILLRFTLWLLLDLAALALAAWLLLPSGWPDRPSPGTFLPAFLTALGAGLASGSPAGLGPFEAVLLHNLPAADPTHPLAAILAFRLAAYALPAIIGAVWVILATPRHPARPAQPRPRLRPAPACITHLRHLPRAEAQLALQGQLHLRATPLGGLWLAARLPALSLHLGDPVTVEGSLPPAALRDCLNAALAEARQDGRLACLYRITPRQAATARRVGLFCLPVAREAILDPATFRTTGPDMASLRRKLRQAGQSGITVTQEYPLPLAEMAHVAALWARDHGGERGFSMGRFTPETLPHQTVLLARDGAGRLLAFLTFHVAAGEWMLDLIRCRPAIPQGTLYLLLARAISLSAEAGIRRLSLAAIPEPGWGLPDPAGRLVLRLQRRHAGLAQFKRSFRPRWERRYIAGANPLSLCLAGVVLAHAIHHPPRLKPFRPGPDAPILPTAPPPSPAHGRTMIPPPQAHRSPRPPPPA